MQPVENFAPRVLAWFDEHGRKSLPWQDDKTPYRVWISEIMLQQTQVTTVIPYYHKFMASFPSVEALAAADQDEVLAHWSGLGYYARARNMHKAAQRLVDEFDSEFPQTVEGVCELSGIGRSTAAAILSISRGVQAAILDGNVKRVLARFHAVPTWPGDKKTEQAMWDLAEYYMPSERCGDYTQAMMDLGATLCTRSKPQCLLCPLQADCQARRTQDPTQFPIRKPKKAAKPEKSIQLLVLVNLQGQLLLEKRPSTGIWGGLWSLPELALDESIVLHTEQRFATQVKRVIPLSPFRHTFSHYHLDIVPSQIQVAAVNGVMEGDKYQWFSPQDAMALGLPAPVRSILEQIN
ncbi:A/G-specific adenine glycosylase [Marinomonas sp. M1K-6]|uniref:Adenine DNA glycosylase n=1 Tax=Marinomonas profundi TaxID=2726122 RepID=A0A847R2P0_9GAMM|nr:A/G-specific adenine glycosylase [Marinomonas profundi]NLQ18072.1 A/G-specific adenine glycosylase [Marinomonas profundi]UDV04141.1 A/G-specific adenine glycosylase [Marinomonas profundi]